MTVAIAEPVDSSAPVATEHAAGQAAVQAIEPASEPAPQVPAPHRKISHRNRETVAFERQQLQALAQRLRLAREEERTRVSHDIHDQIGQILTAIKMDLIWAGKRVPDGEPRRRLSQSIELVNEGVRSVRTICSGLRPGILDDLGLSAAIEWQANEFTARTAIRCEVSVPSFDLKLPPEQTTAVFRIFQESLTNITRHAEATCVHVDLFLDDEELVLEVADDGIGFSPQQATDSLGLLGMRERARSCGGKFQVATSPGQGATVSLKIPLQPSPTNIR